MPADVRLHVCACLSSASVTAAVQFGDSPSSANEERQYGNVAHLCQQATFSSALVYFLVSLERKKNSQSTRKVTVKVI